MFDRLPILGVCGFGGAGKTTLIEAVLPTLIARGLRVAVVKHDAHGLDIDRPGKDSDRFFRAGADVLLQGSGESVTRAHRGELDCLAGALDDLAGRYDLVLVEGHKGTPLAKVWLAGPDADAPPHGVSDVIAALPRDGDRPGALLALLDDWLPRRWRVTPARACVLIGGRSSRMGRAKHLIERDGQTWLARAVALLSPLVEQVVLAGQGVVPAPYSELTRLADAPGVEGPMAGVLSAMRWAPRSSWLAVACDHPALSAEAVGWLLSTRAPGVWATIPRAIEGGDPEPMLAHYDFRARWRMEELAGQGLFGLRRLAEHAKTASPVAPPALAAAWSDANTPAELAQFRPEPPPAGP